jgi:hypothetical protein
MISFVRNIFGRGVNVFVTIFLRFLPNLGEKMAFFLKNQCYVFSKTSSSFSKNANFFGETILKIITSVPEFSDEILKRFLFQNIDRRNGFYQAASAVIYVHAHGKLFTKNDKY